MTTRGWERRQLEESVTKRKAAAGKIKLANILLKVDADGPGWTDEATAQAFRCAATTVHNVRQRLVEHGVKAAGGLVPTQYVGRVSPSAWPVSPVR